MEERYRKGCPMNIFNEREFFDICSRFGVEPRIEEVTIRYSGSGFFNKMKYSVRKDRRGEVIFCVLRPNGKIIAITCKEYPEGVYRIPTGGIGHHEDIVEAVYRETKEELGLQTEISDFGGVIKIRFQHGDDFVMFYSYLFILREVGGRLLLDASDDEISEVKEVDLEELEAIANSLNDIPGKWSDWGKFRHVTSYATFRFLKHLQGL